MISIRLLVLVLLFLSFGPVSCSITEKNEESTPPVPPTNSAFRPSALASSTPVPTSTRIPSPTPTYTPRPADLSRAGLRLEDLPAGFYVLDEASQAQLGITPDSLSTFFENTFQKSRPANTFAFHASDSQPFEVVVGAVFYPLDPSEQTNFDRILADPDQVIANFSQGFNGKTQAMPELSTVGNASIAWSFLSASGQASFKGEMMVFRQESAAGLLMTLSIADKKSLAPIAQLAPLFNRRIQSGLAGN